MAGYTVSKIQQTVIVIQSLSHIQLCNPWTTTCQIPRSSTISQRLLKFMSNKLWYLTSKRSPREEHGNPFQYSWLENPHWQRSLTAMVHWTTKRSDTTEWLTHTHTHTHTHTREEIKFRNCFTISNITSDSTMKINIPWHITHWSPCLKHELGMKAEDISLDFFIFYVLWSHLKSIIHNQGYLIY